MGIPKLLIFKQFFSKRTFKSFKTLLQEHPTKPYFNSPFQFQTRTYARSYGAYNSNLHSKLILNVAISPKISIVPLLEQYVKEGNDVQHNELRKIIRTLRKKNHLDRALEVSEWMTSKLLSKPISADLAVQLDLIGQVHGLDAAESFFNEVDEHSERMYNALLHCYVKANHVDKSLSHFKKMKDMGLATRFAYNNIMSLYLNIGQVEKVPELLLKMEENGVSPDSVS